MSMERKLPTEGKFRGQIILLEDAKQELSPEELREVEVTLEDGSVIRPWRFVTMGNEIEEDDDGVLLI